MFKTLNKWASEAGVSVSDRYKSPIWSSFILSWAVFNWEVLLVLVFPENAGRDGLLAYISDYLEANYWWSATFGPILVALLYSILSGFIRTWFETVALVLKGIAENSKSKFMSGRIAPWEYYQDLIEENRRLNSKENKELDHLVELKSKCEGLERSLSIANSEKKQLVEDFDKARKSESDMMVQFSDSNDKVKAYEIQLKKIHSDLVLVRSKLLKDVNQADPAEVSLLSDKKNEILDNLISGTKDLLEKDFVSGKSPMDVVREQLNNNIKRDK